jgi:hypothetical protein
VDHRDMRAIVRRTRVLAVIVATGVIAAGTALGAAVTPSAHASASPASAAGWRIVAKFPAGSAINSLAASGADDAWAAESCRAPCASPHGALLRHWNGRTWQVAPPTPAAAQTGLATPGLAMTPGSPVAWGVYDEYDNQGRSSVIHWTGKGWAPQQLLAVNSSILALVAPAPDDVWAFGFKFPQFQAPYILRYNGKTWSTAPSPGFTVFDAVARSASDIWALSNTGKHGSFAVSHWTGSRWVSQPAPGIPAGTNAGASIGNGDFVASGPTDLWGCCYVSFARDIKASTNWLLRWNGKAWATVKIPVPLDSVGPLGGDGQGGVWFAGSPGQNLHEYLYHVSALGHWLQRPIPAPPGTSEGSITGFAPIPGTASMYAYGQVDLAKNAGTAGIILKYEP